MSTTSPPPAGGPSGDTATPLSSLSLDGVFGPDSVSLLPAEVKSRLESGWASFVSREEEARVKAEKEKVNREHKTYELECDLGLTRQRLEAKLGELAAANKAKEEALEEISRAKNNTSGVEEQKSLLTSENRSLKRERDGLAAERNDLLDLAERRQTEIDRLNKEWQTLSEQLQQANTEKCNALIKAEEVSSKEVSLNYKEQRLTEEREFLGQQVNMLTEELSRKNEEVLEAKRDQISKLATIQASLSEKTEALRMSEAKATALQEDNERLLARELELTDRLKESRDAQINLEENYRHELKAQTNLAELYKGHSTDAEDKTRELAAAVEELQGLLKQSADRYGDLERNYDNEKLEHKEELKSRGEAIRALRKELEDANTLVKTLQNKGLTPEGIENLSPSAAAASKLIKSGTTLTQIYTSLVSAQEELLSSKDENRRLNSYLDQILKEIEERAPAMKQQREDYDRAVEAVRALTRQLEEARQEYEFRKREAEDARQRAGTVGRENARMRAQVDDLGKQVTVLVREVEASRGGVSPRGNRSLNRSHNVSMDAESVINDRLLTFTDISELQKKNIELLSVVRELSSNKEAAETHLVEEKTSELKAELAAAAAEVEELREARQRQEVLVDSIIHERDVYKSMAERAKNDAPSTEPPKATSTPQVPSTKDFSPRALRAGTTSYHELEKRATSAETKLDEVQKDFDTYRTEKCENERLISEELSKAREDLTEARTKTVKLAAQEEHNSERFKIAQANAQSFRKQVALLETRNTKLNGIVAKHEEQIGLLRTELLSSQSKLSQAEVQMEFLRHERGVLQAAEARLTASNEMLHHQKKSSALVLENLNHIKLRLERDDAERSMAAANRNAALEREVELLRKKIDTEAEEYKATVAAWETKQKELSDKLEEIKEKEREVSEQLAAANLAKDDLQAKLSEASEKLDAAESALAGRGVSALARQDSNVEVSAKVRDLTHLLNQSKAEANTLKEQLTQAKEASTQYKDIADSAEKRLVESNNASKALKDDLEARLKAALEEKATALAKMEEEARTRAGDGSGDAAELRAQLETVKTSLSIATQQLESTQRGEAAARAETERQVALAQEAQARYERELVQHAQDVETLNQLRAAAAGNEAKTAELAEAHATAESRMQATQQNLSALEAQSASEYEKLKEQFAVVEQENASLHTQLSTVSQQMASLQRHFEGGDAANTSASGDSAGPAPANLSFSEEDCKSTEQLMQIIKFNRREKEILTGKLEVTSAETTRLRSQLDHSQRQLSEATSALKLAQQEKASTAMSSTKYAELLTKVQTASALSDSNAMLREEKTKLLTEIEETRAKLRAVEGQSAPLKDQVQRLGENLEAANVELSAVKADNTRWRARANQLVERQSKINPEELKRLQTDNSTQAKQIMSLTAQHKTLQTANAAGTARIKTLTDQVNAKEQGLRAKEMELQKAVAETKKLQSLNQSVGARFKAQNDRNTQLESLVAKLKSDNDGLIKTRGEAATGLKEQVTAKDAEIAKMKGEAEAAAKKAAETRTLLAKLKNLGRTYKEKSEKLEAELKEAKEAKAKVESELKDAKESATAAAVDAATAAVAGSSGEGGETVADLKKQLAHADEMVRASSERIDELEGDLEAAKAGDNAEEMQKLKEQNKTQKAAMDALDEKSKRSINMLKIAREKINKLEQDNQDLKAKAAQQAQQQPKGQQQQAQAALNAAKKSYEEKLNALTAEKNTEVQKLQATNESLKKEQQELKKTLEELQQQQQQQQQQKSSQQETVTASVKPTMSSPSTAGGQASGSQQQQQPSGSGTSGSSKPGAHIQPTRHQPATATIRPVVTAARQQTVVHPNVFSVSPQAQQQQQQPSLSANAPEFVPRVAPTAHVQEVESSDESTPRARVLPRHHQDSDSEAASSAPGPSRASVAPTPKRPREEGAGPGEPKKARVTPAAATYATAATSSTSQDDDVVDLEDTEEEEDEEDEVEAIEQDDALQVEEDFDDDGAQQAVGPDDETEGEEDEGIEPVEEEMGEANNVLVLDEGEGEDVEEDVVEIDDDDEEEEEEVAIMDLDQMASDRGEDSSSQFQLPGQSDEGVQIVSEAEAGGNEAVAGPSRLVVHPQAGGAAASEQLQEEGVLSAAGGEESVAAVRQQPEEGGPAAAQAVGGQYDQDQDDGVVPGTPKPGSSAMGTSDTEASSSRGFPFGASIPLDVAVSSSSAASVSAAGRAGVDRTAVDFAQFVPTTSGGSMFGQQQSGGVTSQAGSIFGQQASAQQQQGPSTSEAGGNPGEVQSSEADLDQEVEPQAQQQEPQQPRQQRALQVEPQAPSQQHKLSDAVTSSDRSGAGSSSEATAARGGGAAGGRGRIRRTPIVWGAESPGGPGAPAGARRGAGAMGGSPSRGQKARRSRGGTPTPRGGGGSGGGGPPPPMM